jgi:hypothetical protein
MAAMLSAVSNAFSGQAASSIVSDTDEDGSVDRVWEERNLSKSQVRSPKKNTNDEQKRIEPLFNFRQEGAWRDEIEVEINTKNKKKFTGTITPTEAKHLIYIKALGFENHSNFDGVRINFKGKLIVTFKLIEPINIDELDSVEHFDFVRATTVNGKRHDDVIGCRIRGIRYRPMMVSSFDTAPKEDGNKVVKIEGCKYRVTKEEILQWLSHYGEVTSNLEEDVFRDEVETDGNNRTGNYTVMMKLEKPIPQLLPMCGKRVKMYHAGIVKLCTNCFGHHKKSACQNEKVQWVKYVQNFIEENEEFPPEMYGKWLEIIDRIKEEANNNPGRTRALENEQNSPLTNSDVSPDEANHANNPELQANEVRSVETESASPDEAPPLESDFDIPTTKEAYESMIDRFLTVGISKIEADEAITKRTTAFNKACREHKKRMTEKKKQEGWKIASNTRKSLPKKKQ